jgi:hypothetical protein
MAFFEEILFKSHPDRHKNIFDELIIDPHPVSSYNTVMASVFNYFAGFFRPDHDPPFA